MLEFHYEFPNEEGYIIRDKEHSCRYTFLLYIAKYLEKKIQPSEQNIEFQLGLKVFLVFKKRPTKYYFTLNLLLCRIAFYTIKCKLR